MIVYTKTGCPWCVALLAFLNEAGVEYEERDVRKNEDYMAEMSEKSGQTKAPVVDYDGEIIADTDKDEIAEFLREKGVIS